MAMVIMDRQDYITKANNLLSQNTYSSIPWDPTNTIKNKLINILKRVTSQIPHLGLLYPAVDLLPMVWPKNLLKS